MSDDDHDGLGASAESQAGDETKDWEAHNKAIQDGYIELLAPLFLPKDPTKPDILDYFCALLRVGGWEDGGWDPYGESRVVLNEIHELMKVELPEKHFPDHEKTIIRLGLIFYSHIVEMDAPYEVIANLLRFKLDLGYSLQPFFDFLSAKEQKQYRYSGIYPSKKIEIIKKLGLEAGLDLGSMFDDFYDNGLRNAISHSSFAITDTELRCRSWKVGKSFSLTLQELDEKILCAKLFIGAFFALEVEARRQCGEAAGRALAYDPHYKGIMEVLVNEEGLMDGYKVHWPNGSDSYYRRTPQGAKLVNCLPSAKRPAVELFVGLYARQRSQFSPLVEQGAEPIYTPLENGEPTVWAP
ncbi:hypothetical protein G7A66_13355 [Altererythrobacter sp. SALINAS58]|uniref:hypothetical protein n=1 Tax=Alteripontixanthobacter muriae TaxID=2705546 RepID=UPI0015766B77|nr:hypothetical protein [Alteripontixanthobacter muriae]NTZ44047.1 hypothetical protein [Alteripontixanthobacter muriae]